ncbi:MAG: FAD-dependent monooxygenase, partial [Alphaproteobacteria bacterium]|nr:FAD-dependent monooxygenase [Alphaproteobacteria bacterium]
MPVSVAIVGSGPAGFYTADALLKSGVEVRIDIIERLPTPFGLIRDGV